MESKKCYQLRYAVLASNIWHNLCRTNLSEEHHNQQCCININQVLVLRARVQISEAQNGTVGKYVAKIYVLLYVGLLISCCSEDKGLTLSKATLLFGLVPAFQCLSRQLPKFCPSLELFAFSV